MHLSNTKLNAAGLTPDRSLVLPERAPLADELPVLQSLIELYTSSPTATTLAAFSPQVVFTMPTGDVAVGHKGIQGKFDSPSAEKGQRKVHQRLLQTPESLPARTMCIDQVISFQNGSSPSVRNLIVLKRRAVDGLITTITEEEGHRRATAPLAARAAAGNNFYSPTDNMVSPCTSKLNLVKKKHHLRGTPKTLFPSKLTNKSSPPGSADAEMGLDDA